MSDCVAQMKSSNFVHEAQGVLRVVLISKGNG